jgi:hypothetical protein
VQGVVVGDDGKERVALLFNDHMLLAKKKGT